MLSILIPTYHYNAHPLAAQIEKLALKSGVDFEIICIDNGSNSSLNTESEKINTLVNSKFIAAKKNIGLSNNRNALAKISQYDYLLFIDGDSVIIDDAFISNYLHAIKKNPDVVYGGRIHPKHVEPHRKLRWKYGIYIEDLPAASREKNMYKCVLFNNTLIKKSIFNSIEFEKSITNYGHEDTVFAYQLSKLKTRILHIDNPVLHGDVDFNKVFFEKTKKSLKNLNSIYKTNLVEPNFVKLLNVFSKLNSLKLNYVLAYFYRVTAPFYKFQLTSKYPSLFVFNLFRLTYFCNINLKK
jgi:glycosyltransferase involved in cell wall biosynthesis